MSGERDSIFCCVLVYSSAKDMVKTTGSRTREGIEVIHSFPSLLGSRGQGT